MRESPLVVNMAGLAAGLTKALRTFVFKSEVWEVISKLLSGEFMGQFSMRQVCLGATTALVLVLGSSSAVCADSPPKIDHSYPTQQPAYPDSAQLSGEQGDVLVGVHVNASGKPRKLRIDKSSGFGDLDDAAAAAVAQWRFIPAIEKGDTTSAWTTVKIHFELPLPVQPTYAMPADTKH